MDQKKVEILAPAGSFDCLKAALAGGADAVYVGGDRYSARAYAHNFDQEELIRAIDYVHFYGKKLYLTLNILLKESEIGEELVNWLMPLYEHGLDAVIVQDLGICRFLKVRFPGLPIHASTQMSLTSTEGTKLMKEYGIRRVIPARELSLDEIRSMAARSGIEIEAFVHGAMCYAYSGKCLFSSCMGERSGNRGRCAQPCRLAYTAPGDNKARYWLSMQDLSMIERIGDLIAAGVCSFKIEGRMKSAQYVYAVTSLYRKYTDLFLESGINHVLDHADKKMLAGFSRMHSGCGYYDHRNGPEMITLDDPSFRSRTHDADILFNNEPDPIEVISSVKIEKGSPAVLTLSVQDVAGKAISKGNVQQAQRSPLVMDDVKRRLTKTDWYPFHVNWSDMIVDADAFLPVSMLNDMRREALVQLSAALLKRYYRKAPLNAPQSARSACVNPSETCTDKKRPVHTLVTNHAQFKSVLQSDYVTMISVESDRIVDPHQIKNMIDECRHASFPKKFCVALPHIARFDGDKEKLPVIFSEPFITALNKADSVLVRNLDEAYFLTTHGYEGTMLADHLLYGFNSQSLAFLRENGFNGVCYPLEMHHKDIINTEKAWSGFDNCVFDREVFVYGFAPRMISAQCVQKNTQKCTHRSGMLVMKDRKGQKFAVQNRCESCYNIIYNQVPISLHKRIHAISHLPLGYRFDFVWETEREISSILSQFSGETDLSVSYPYTKGHWDKGVL